MDNDNDRHVYDFERQFTTDPRWNAIGGLGHWSGGDGGRQIHCDGRRIRRVLWAVSGNDGWLEHIAEDVDGNVVCLPNRVPARTLTRGHVVVDGP